MIKCLLLVPLHALVDSKPQYNNFKRDSSVVEIEKQQVVALKPHGIEENSTKEILEKIAQVNKKQGLIKNPFKTRYYPINGRSTNFQVPPNPYFNPIPDYVQQYPESSNYQEEQVPPGQYIKRKIIYQQSMLVPNPAFIPPQQQTVDNIKNIMENAYYQSLTPQLTRQSWQWPLGNMFPIVFKDPFTHMMNAMTTIVEYGPDAGKPKPCAKSLDESIEENPNYPTIDIEDLHITNNPEDPVELNISIKPKLRQEKKQDPSLIEDTSKEDSSSEENSEEEIEKALTQESNKKFFSKDNTGNGIFVQRIKVRKGGVAIAGPGGIATAGSGGTAIVGPNGFAYTHPDSLAIAGSGTKVVAVDPGVNLSEIVLNSTKSGGHVPRLTYPFGLVIPNNIAQEDTAAILTSPYKAHPLFHFLKNKNTIQSDKIISFRNENSTFPVTSLILKPVAKAVAGVDGKAISMPLSKAVLRRGTNVDILFEPEAVAIVGPGGIAHAQSNLEITYEDYNIFLICSYIAETHPKVTLIPFYGGGKGQSLQIVEKADGSVMTYIIKTPEKKPIISEETINASELENPPLPSKQDRDFSSNIRNIHKTALDIIKLQDVAKKSGHLSPEQEKAYKKNMDSLNTSAKNLAELQEEEDEFSFENREGLAAWFERKKNIQKEKDNKKKEEEDKKKLEGEKNKEEKKPEGEKNKEQEEEKEEESEDTDGIAIGLPPEDASVAEAKPVGLAVAGEGGVAASKPIATAVVGPGGLAIARPVGTAIAGVAPDQALVPIYAEGYVLGNKPNKKHSKNKPPTASEYLNKIITKYHQV